MKKGYDRKERVADMLQKELAQMLLTEMNDDRFRLVTVTSVTISSDLSYAKIYVSALIDDETKIKELVQDLNRAAKGLRYSLAKKVKLRIVPELRFSYDESTAHGFKISGLINKALKNTDEE